MVIAFGNIKPGTGKSTLLLLLASYLASKEKKKIYLIDMQADGTLGLLFERSIILEHQLPFEYYHCDLAHFELLNARLAAEDDAYVFIELPSSMHDERILGVFSKLDLLFCPFCYDRPTLNSTIYFASLAKRIKTDLSLVFLPNRIVSSAGYEFKQEIDSLLRQISPLSTGIGEHIGFQRISSLQLEPRLIERYCATLDLIYSLYLTKQA